MRGRRGREPVSKPLAGRRIRILGTRGVPNAHSGFEAFAEALAPYLVERGWDVVVYCQEDAATWTSPDADESVWRGVRRVHIPIQQAGPLGTIVFDWRCTLHALRDPLGGTALVLGYNTALFSLLYKLRGVKSVMNMDGIEWRRAKWGPLERLWFFVNEWLGCLLSDHLIADHPAIALRLERRRRVAARRISMIPYGAREVRSASTTALRPLGLAGRRYALVIARPEPENSILEIVRAFSRRRRDCALVVVGPYGRDVKYQRRVLEAASDEVLFPGPIFDHPTVDALRLFACLYVHGHTVGGTNPSLVEALGAGLPVLARDNEFNRWVAAGAGHYFRDEDECERQFSALLAPQSAGSLDGLRAAARARHAEAFTPPRVLDEYAQLLASVS